LIHEIIVFSKINEQKRQYYLVIIEKESIRNKFHIFDSRKQAGNQLKEYLEMDEY
jgi:hypothetical protein